MCVSPTPPLATASNSIPTRLMFAGSLHPLLAPFLAHSIPCLLRLLHRTAPLRTAPQVGKREAKAKRNARVWNVLDNNFEEVHVQRGKKIADASRRFMPAETKQRMKKQKSRSVDTKGLDVDEGYAGAHLSLPVQLEDVLTMLEQFKSGILLHYKYATLVLDEFRRVMGAEQAVVHVTVRDGIRLTVVGDTHGQLADLYTIFTINGLPSDTNWYLFNGDYVDRGAYGCEVFLTLAAFKLLYPGSVFMNRGNHEARAQNSWMGFEEEVFSKYEGEDPEQARQMYALFETCFDNLPLATVIQTKIFVCHGGLFRMNGVKLQHINSIHRKREPPLEEPGLEDQLFEDLLWSDPRPSSTFPRPCTGRRQSERGAGVEFGADVTTRFCGDNAIALVIRSHECVEEGFEVLHNGRLITIFSASRYCGTQTNKGAFLVLDKSLQPEIQQFYAHSMDSHNFLDKAKAEGGAEGGGAEDEAASSQEMENARNDKLEEDAVRMIVERIVAQKPDLYWYFTQGDKDRTGFCTRLEWQQVMLNVLGMELPYLQLQPRLAETDPANGLINYTTFLERYRVEMRSEDMAWQGTVIETVCRKIFSSCSDLKEAFKVFDINDDGSIEYEEFLETLKGLNLGLTDQQIFELMRSIDENANATIDFNEFASRFQVTFNEMKLASGSRQASSEMTLAESKLGEIPAHDLMMLQNIAAAMFAEDMTIQLAFARFDTNGDGWLRCDNSGVV